VKPASTAQPGPFARGYTPWGTSAAIDLHGCSHATLADPGNIAAFVRDLVAAIGMRAHGPLHLERFGSGELEGWSAMQFIETSSITVHADEVSGRCFADVFSCRPLDADLAAAVASLASNWNLLDRTAASTNALSKCAYELAGPRTRRLAACGGYLARR
jgi:S-adenosylmethionine/arginine decarboxylase-like enzyme